MNLPDPPTLADLPRNASARIAEVVGNDAVARRLREMGLLSGQIVRRAGTAPLGDPTIYFVRGFRLALRRTEACRILLEPGLIDDASAERIESLATERIEPASA